MNKAKEELFVCIGHWASISAVQSFNRKLANWEYLLDNAFLEHLQIKAEGTVGCWRISSVNTTPLKKKLLDFVEPRYLDYVFSANEKDFKEITF